MYVNRIPPKDIIMIEFRIITVEQNVFPNSSLKDTATPSRSPDIAGSRTAAVINTDILLNWPGKKPMKISGCTRHIKNSAAENIKSNNDMMICKSFRLFAIWEYSVQEGTFNSAI